MAFARKVGNVLKRTAMSSNSSLFQTIRCISSKIFIGGLSFSTDDTTLKEAFSHYGDVIEARIIIDRDSGRSRGFGFITYASSEDASAAITAMDGKDLQGRILRVSYANDRASGIRGGGGFGGGGFGSGAGYAGGGGARAGYGGAYNNASGGGYSGGGSYHSAGGHDGTGGYGGAGGYTASNPDGGGSFNSGVGGASDSFHGGAANFGLAGGSKFAGNATPGSYAGDCGQGFGGAEDIGGSNVGRSNSKDEELLEESFDEKDDYGIKRA